MLSVQVVFRLNGLCQKVIEDVKNIGGSEGTLAWIVFLPVVEQFPLHCAYPWAMVKGTVWMQCLNHDTVPEAIVPFLEKLW